MTPQEIESGLGNFFGSATFTRWSPLFRNDLLTEGALFVAEECGAYWLMDAIASHQPSLKNEDFQVWTLAKDGPRWLLTATDGGRMDDEPIKLITQHIPFSDFPLEKIELWAVRNELGGFTIMVPTEY